jgi:hypothetical protein
MTSTQKFVLVAMADMANEQEDFKCWPSLTHLAKKTGLGKSTVVRAINYLVTSGYISRSEIGDYSGKRTVYQVHCNPSVTAGLGPQREQPSTTAGHRTLNEPLDPVLGKTKISADWKPSIKVLEWTRNQGIPDKQVLVEIVPSFVAYWLDTGEKRKSWDATFMRNPIVKREITNYKHRNKGNGNKRKTAGQLAAEQCNDQGPNQEPRTVQGERVN